LLYPASMEILLSGREIFPRISQKATALHIECKALH
jgi:hypothetical protein